ncbi:ribonuclease H-like domain-containing protein, partial [Tanacetum coccineum]
KSVAGLSLQPSRAESTTEPSPQPSRQRAEADVARGHGGDVGGDDHPPNNHIPTGCGGCFVNRGKGTRKPNLGGRKAGQLHTRQETRNLGLKKIIDGKGPVPIPLIMEMICNYPSWQKVSAERKAAIVTKIEHLQKLYNTNKASLKAAHWVINPETGTYDVERIRERRPESITPTDWDAQIAFWNDPRNQAQAAQNRQNRAKSTVVCRQGSRSLARLRDEMMVSSETREYRRCSNLLGDTLLTGYSRGMRTELYTARDVLIRHTPPLPSNARTTLADVENGLKEEQVLTKRVKLDVEAF